MKIPAISSISRVLMVLSWPDRTQETERGSSAHILVVEIPKPSRNEFQ